MAEAIISSSVEMLGNLLIQECCFLFGVRNQVEELKRELQSAQSYLNEAYKRSHKDERVRNWIKSVRNVAYKIEDVLETYAIKVESKKGKGVKGTLKRYACILAEGVDLHKLGVEIGNIIKEIDGINSNLQTYGIKFENEGQSLNAASKNSLRQTVAHKIEEHFVGMRNDVGKLVKLMADREKGHQIISIVAMGGSGKTTLAKQVFNHGDVRKHFESFAWVAISQQFEKEDVLKDILRQLDGRRNKNDIERMKSPELCRELHEFQRKKKCLVVVDDIWKREHWDVGLSDAFPTTSVDCKVLLTTRIQDVAKIGIPHRLNLFSEKEGVELLMKKAFNNKNVTDSNLEAEQEKLGKEMVRKCGYLPLPISVIGGILNNKDTLEDWEMVNEDIDSYLRHGEGVEDNDQVMQILTLSYDDLPYQLKPCLLYLAYYPEDTEINLEKLYWMWIAEDLILSKDQRPTESLMDVAERYLNVLASKSLVQVRLNEVIYRVPTKSCLMHDLIRDLCVSKCEEEDFLQVIDHRKRKQPNCDLKSLEGNAYRLVICRSKDDGNVYNMKLEGANSGARAFSLTSYSEIGCGVLEDLRNLQFLKIVTFEGLDFSNNTQVLHKVIKKLIHLRCLIFVKCKLKEVPSAVGELTYLQTFHLSCPSLYDVEIPNVFWKLKRLLHFVLLGNDVDIKPCELRLDFSSGLETLIISSKYHPAIKDLSKWTNLRVFKLCVSDSKNLSLIIDFMKRKWHSKADIAVRILSDWDLFDAVDEPNLLCKLFWCHAIQKLQIWSVYIRELPKYELGMLSDLVDLEIWYNNIEEDPMPTLEKLPKLKLLTLNDCFLGEELICSSTGFPNLLKLELHDLCNLKNWRIDDGSMPNVIRMVIWGCHKLEMIPTGMKSLKALRRFETYSMSKEFNDRIRIVNGEEGADFHKVRHVRSIDIINEGVAFVLARDNAIFIY